MTLRQQRATEESNFVETPPGRVRGYAHEHSWNKEMQETKERAQIRGSHRKEEGSREGLGREMEEQE